MSTIEEKHESNTSATASSSEEQVTEETHQAAEENTTASMTSSDEQKEASEPSEVSAEASTEDAGAEASTEEVTAEATAEATAEGAEAEETDAKAEENDEDTEIEVEEELDEKTKYKRAVEALVDEITEKLEEPNIRLTRTVVYTIGIEKCREYLERTIAIEEEGGVIITRGNRRRTPGGIFYWLVKEDLTPKEIRTLFPLPKRPVDKAKRNAARKARKIRKREELIKEVAESWGSRAEVIKEVIKSKNYGKAKTIKVTMIGRPGKIIKQKGFMMTTMRSPDRSPSLPKELPSVEPSKLVYLVYIGNKQWKRVAKRIKNPEDTLIVEGYLGYEKALKKMVIFGQMVTTIHIQQERREKQRQEAEKKKAAEEKKKAEEEKKKAAKA